jgi:hypothetical protein
MNRGKLFAKMDLQKLNSNAKQKTKVITQKK